MGTDNRIDSNSVIRNDRGIELQAAGNLVIRNSASGSTDTGIPSADYNFGGHSTTYGEIISTPGKISADPWANFSF